jgi:hypothetical protein
MLGGGIAPRRVNNRADHLSRDAMLQSLAEERIAQLVGISLFGFILNIDWVKDV